MHLPSLFLVFLAPFAAASASAVEAKPAYQAPETLTDGWQVTDATATQWKVAQFAELEAAIAKGTYPGVTSVVVAHEGKLVYERYFNGGDRETLNDTRSATKSITALLVGAAIDRGLIPGVEASAYGLFKSHPHWQHPDPRKQKITVEDLLTMSSVLECDDENQFSSGNEERMYVSENWTQFVLDLPIKGFAPWMTRPQDSPHGRAFSYCTAGSYLLGAAVEEACGRKLSDFAGEVLERPLGITQSKWNQSPLGVGMGGGGTRYRSRDLLKLGQLMVDGGRWNGHQVLPAHWVDQALTIHAQAREDADYGYQFWRFRFLYQGKEQGAWAMSGNGGNYVFMVPEKNLVAVITRTSYNQRGVHEQSQKMFGDYLLKAMP